MIEGCGVCGVYERKQLSLEWNADTGWRWVCDGCRLVPKVTGPGEWHFVRVGGK